MAAHTNPYLNSRLINICRWSGCPEVENLVLAVENSLKRTTAFRLTPRRREHIRTIVLDLYHRHLEEPAGYIAYSRDTNFYTIPARYNPRKIGYGPTIAVVDALASANLIDGKHGFRDPRTGRSFRARMKATSKLVQLIERDCHVDGSMLDVDPHAETVILRDSNKKDIDYQEDKRTHSMRGDLKKYNQKLRKTCIDINLDGYTNAERINLGNKFVRRVFNNSSFNEGGRFYGGWWQSASKELRPRIQIQGKPGIEFDFSGMQIVLAYGLEGIDYFSTGLGDPYQTNKIGPQDRKLMKKVSLVALNARTQQEARGAIQVEVNKGDLALPLGMTVMDVLQEFEVKHKRIKKYFYAGQATRFQNLDSLVAERIVNYMTQTENMPVLVIHDSFIVANRDEHILMQVMVKALNDTLKAQASTANIDPKIDRVAWFKPGSEGLVPLDVAKLLRALDNPLDRRWEEWHRTKRQGFVIHDPRGAVGDSPRDQ